jgi:hypothetical protein
MQLADFVAMNNAEQIRSLTTKGVRLGNRADEQYQITLYQIDGFYVEVHYHKVEKHVTHIGAFSTIEPLEPYLAEMDITNLIK